jgi:phospholipase C
MMKRLFKQIQQDRRAWSANVLVAVCVSAALLITAVALIATKAATSVVASETDTGTLSTRVRVASDTTASAGKAIVFENGINASHPCGHLAAPAQWKHVILLMFENESYGSVIGNAAAPYITGLAHKCGSATGWKDGNYRVDGTIDGNYVSKPSYATLTSGLSPSVTGITDDTYATTTSADNIFNRLNLIGKSTKSYQAGGPASCAVSNFSGAYHDAMRYYTNLGGQSSSPSTYCNTHDVSISTLMSDINSGNLPAFSLLLPTNDQNMHNNGVASGDAYAQSLIDPILNSAQYKSGDTAIFFLWDEDTPIPNVLMAPSIVPDSLVSVPANGNPLTHFSFTRTTQEMLGVPQPFLGVSGNAPSLLNYFNGN